MTTLPTLAAAQDRWQHAFYSFLAEKHRRSGSLRTPAAYSSQLQHFFGRTGKTPDQVTSQDVFGWAYSKGSTGRAPGSVTVGARIACVSSFFRFLIRMSLVPANPCDMLERPKAVQSVPRGLAPDDVKRLLAVIPDSRAGVRDRAIILVLVLTGRRRAEVLGLKAGDIEVSGPQVFYRYRGKGGKAGRRELPRPAFEAIERALAAWGKTLAGMGPDEPLWPSKGGKGLTTGSFYGRFQRHLTDAGLPRTGPHSLRHSAAKLRRDAGETVEDVSRFLDHSSLAVTSVYLRRLEGVEDRTWGAVAAAIGV